MLRRRPRCLFRQSPYSLRAWVCAGLGGFLAWGPASVRAHDTPPWVVVQPLTRTDLGGAIAQHFASTLPRYLGAPVTVHAPTAGKGLEGLMWAKQPAVAQHTLVLMSSTWWSRIDERSILHLNVEQWVPLQMVLQGSWCLMAAESPVLASSQALQARLASLRRPVRLGMLHRFGMSEVWMQAMSRKTGLSWQSQSYALVEDAVKAVREGEVDLLLDRCAAMAKPLGRVPPQRRSKADRPVLQVLAHSGQHHAWNAPTFSQWQLPPLEAGWVAWFVPAGMAPATQKRAAQALQAVLQRDDTQELIVSLQYTPTRWSTEATQKTVQQSLQDHRLLRNWVQMPSSAEEATPNAAPR